MNSIHSAKSLWSAAIVAVVALIASRVPPALARPKQPILAVFTIQDKTGKLGEAASQLTDYLVSQIGAGGVFQVVPSSQLKERLVEQKKDSYKDCFDQRCQVEIGRELAAQKSLSTQILAVGSKCAVTSVLYDLASATSETSASQMTGCTQDEMVAAIEKVALALKNWQRQRDSARATPAPAVPTTGDLALDGVPAGARIMVDKVFRGVSPLGAALKLEPRQHMVAVDLAGYAPWQKTVTVHAGKLDRQQVRMLRIAQVTISSTPAGATVLLDGKPRGSTPVTVPLVEGSRYELALDKVGYQPLRLTVDSEKPTRSYALALSQRGRRTRTEWIAFTPCIAAWATAKPGFGGGGLAFELVTLKWPWLAWNILEVGASIGDTFEETSTGGTPNAEVRGGAYGLTRLSVPVFFGANDSHQLRAGLGFGVWIGPKINGSGAELALDLAPSLEYRYQTSGRWFFGGGLRMLVPVGAGHRGLGGVPMILMLSFPIGVASLP